MSCRSRKRGRCTVRRHHERCRAVSIKLRAESVLARLFPRDGEDSALDEGLEDRGRQFDGRFLSSALRETFALDAGDAEVRALARHGRPVISSLRN